MDDANRLKALRRAVVLQATMRDRALATRASLAAQEHGIAARENAVLLALDAEATGALHGILISAAAQRLESLARERATLQAKVSEAEATAAHHARLARAGEKRGKVLARDVQTRAERAALEAILERKAIATSPG